MAKSFKATWLGDADPLQQIITLGGQRFIKGEAVSVSADNPMAEKIRANPMFSVEKGAEPIESDEPEPVDPAEGTELGAARLEAQRLGLTVKDSEDVDAIRGHIAAHFAKVRG